MVEREQIRRQDVQRRLVETMTQVISISGLAGVVTSNPVRRGHTVPLQGAHHPPPNDVLDGGPSPVEQDGGRFTLLHSYHVWNGGGQVGVHERVCGREVRMPRSAREDERSLVFDDHAEGVGEVTRGRPHRGIHPPDTGVLLQHFLLMQITNLLAVQRMRSYARLCLTEARVPSFNGEKADLKPAITSFYVFIRHTFLLPVEIRNSCLSEAEVTTLIHTFTEAIPLKASGLEP